MKILSEGVKKIEGPFDNEAKADDWRFVEENYEPWMKVVKGFDSKWYVADCRVTDDKILKFQNGTKVTVKDPVWFDEERSGFVAKQVDDNHFLVKLDAPFTRTNPGKVWLKVSREYAHQVVFEK